MELHDKAKKSWINIPDNSDFSLHNIPFGIFKTNKAQVGIAVGEYVLDLNALERAGYFAKLNLPTGIFNNSYLNEFFTLGRTAISSVRTRIIELLDAENTELKNHSELVALALHRQANVELLMPVKVSNYTDFYSSEEHARNVGSMFRDPANALLPNWKHLPVAYHGRASSIVVSGTGIHRPEGQIKKTESDSPVLAPSAKLDFELEAGFIMCGETQLGHPINIEDTEKYIAGVVLFNDWSARDIQQWEYVPLGPFLGKNFGSSISPWVVTLDALEPFRSEGPAQEPKVLSYLQTEGKRNFDVMLEVLLKTQTSEETVLCRTNMKYLYWSVNQQLAHHTVNGCNIQVGDIYASGTISGPSSGSYGSLLELTWNGKKVLSMPDGTIRTFLEDGDTVIMKGHAERNGIRVGFGECRGKILPSFSN